MRVSQIPGKIKPQHLVVISRNVCHPLKALMLQDVPSDHLFVLSPGGYPNLATHTHTVYTHTHTCGHTHGRVNTETLN